MSKHLKADNIRTLCGIDFSVLDYKVAEVVELPEDATCEWCVAEATTSDTSNISNKFTELDAILVAYDCLEAKQALTAYIEKEKIALLDELLEHKEQFFDDKDYSSPTAYDESLKGIGAVPVSVLLAKKKDLNQGGEDE